MALIGSNRNMKKLHNVDRRSLYFSSNINLRGACYVRREEKCGQGFGGET